MRLALQAVMKPLLRLPDEHVLATICAVVLVLREDRAGLPIGGVFRAGKTRSLLVFDPELRLMVLTKKNVAAHAFAEHLVALQLPEEAQQKIERLVGYYEQLHKVRAPQLISHWRTAISTCGRNRLFGGGFQQECGQPYSPVAEWMRADVALEDEGQRYNGSTF